MESTPREYKSPRKQSPSFFTVTLPFADMIRRASIKCKQSPVYRVLWPLLPYPSTDRNETPTWSSLLSLGTFP